MMIWRRLLGTMAFVVGCAWLASSFGLIPLRSGIAGTLQATFFVLAGFGVILDWRSRKRLLHKELSPARSAVYVIMATGAVAVLTTARNVDSTFDYVVPAVIALATILLVVVAFRFASKNRDRIGEARFDTGTNSR